MATEIRLRHPTTGEKQIAYEGYSWTSLFFGAFPALLRGDIAIGLAVLLVIVVLAAGAFVAGYPTWLTTGIVGAIWGQFYNKIYYDRLRRAGYERDPDPPPMQT